LRAQKRLRISFLGKFVEAHPEALVNANDPDMQMALFQVQREYARSGDKELGALLVDMLVDRSGQTGRSRRQLVLNEALNTAPRITHEGIACLSVLWLIKRVRHGVGDKEELYDSLRRNLARFAEGLDAAEMELRHLEYAGCVSIGIGESDIIEILRITYQGLFTNGFDRSEPDVEGLVSSGILIPCLRNPQRWQVNALNQQLLDEALIQYGVEEHKQRLEVLLNTGTMTALEIEQQIRQVVPELGSIIDTWRSSLLKHADLTSVGVAIGHANWRRVTGNTEDISIWLV
jgi:hypothetical protein